MSHCYLSQVIYFICLPQWLGIGPDFFQKMVKSCSAYGCTNRFSKNGISFHKFPLKDKILLRKWLVATLERDVPFGGVGERNVPIGGVGSKSALLTVGTSASHKRLFCLCYSTVDS